MAQRIAAASRISGAALPQLAVLPFAAPAEVDQGDAEVLAQLLAVEIANGGNYAVLPRTATIQSVMVEHRIQRSGITEADNIKVIGSALNAQYVLAGSVRILGRTNLFTAEIIHLETGEQVIGTSVEYTALNDGIRAMGTLSRELTGTRSGGFNGKALGYGALNLALGLGSFIQKDWPHGLLFLGGYAAAGGLIAWEMGLEYEDALAGIPGVIGLGVAGATALYGFIRPFIYEKHRGLINQTDRISAFVVPGNGGTAALSLTYTLRF
jgi:TolB-like protein